jgi:hypothetical protein
VSDLRVGLCLDCVRDTLASRPFVPNWDVTGGIPDECTVCGRPFPESRKRELKAENLILRAKLAMAEADALDLRRRLVVTSNAENEAKNRIHIARGTLA